MICVTARGTGTIVPVHLSSHLQRSHDLLRDKRISIFGHSVPDYSRAFRLRKLSVMVAKHPRSIEIAYPSFFTQSRAASRGRVSRERLVPRDLGNFMKHPVLRSLPFIYGNPLSNAVGGSETSLDLALPPAAYGRGKPLPLDVRVSTRPIWLTFRKLEKTHPRPTGGGAGKGGERAVYRSCEAGELSSAHIVPVSSPTTGPPT